MVTALTVHVQVNMHSFCLSHEKLQLGVMVCLRDSPSHHQYIKLTLALCHVHYMPVCILQGLGNQV